MSEDKETVEEFLRRGGEIKQVPHGATAEKSGDWKLNSGDWLRNPSPSYWKNDDEAG